MHTRHAVVPSKLGDLTLVASDGVLTGVYFPRHWHRPAVETFGPRVQVERDALLREAATQLMDYLNGDRTGFDLPVRADGDEFHQRVWALLEQIPPGTTTSYGSLAGELGDPSLAWSVGRAVGRNPLSVIIPCHRVVGRDGSLTGYAGGLRRKRFLLDLEEPASVLAARLF